MRNLKKFHLIGIGGSGMSGIAEILLDLGYQVTGSDLQANTTTARLAKLGAQIYCGHAATNLAADTEVVVISGAILDNNPELQLAQQLRLPVVPRAQMLAELMRFQQGIAISGTHGKTTTTSLVAALLTAADLDPTCVVGGQLNHLAGSSAKLGNGGYFVIEADESDGSFLFYNPIISVITNIDLDHIEKYAYDQNLLQQGFIDFVHRLPFYGTAIICLDDPIAKAILPKLSRRYLSYGQASAADLQLISWQPHAHSTSFTVRLNRPKLVWPMVVATHSDSLEQSFTVNLLGYHNVLNSLAAICVALELGIDFAAIQRGLAEFQGVGRRMQVIQQLALSAQVANIRIIDDYGHHPAEIKAVLSALRASCPNSRVILVYQPHKYTRTAALFADFVRELSQADILVLLDTYPAGENLLPGATSQDLVDKLRLDSGLAARSSVDVQFAASDRLEIHYLELYSWLATKQLALAHQALWQLLQPKLQGDDIILLQGAGNIGNLAEYLSQQEHACFIS